MELFAFFCIEHENEAEQYFELTEVGWGLGLAGVFPNWTQVFRSSQGTPAILCFRFAREAQYV